MAWKMKLVAPWEGMTAIWNVSHQVGEHAKCMNATDDVELVQQLICSIHQQGAPTTRSPGIGVLRATTGRMDALTAFEILWGDAVVYEPEDDGILIPAKMGLVSYGANYWAIARLNLELFRRNRPYWESLPERCSPSLKSNLLTKTSP